MQTKHVNLLASPFSTIEKKEISCFVIILANLANISMGMAHAFHHANHCLTP